MPVPPVIEWRDGAVYILDQRRLPDAIEVLRCDSVPDVVDAIRTLAIRGAPALGVAAAYAVALGAARLDAEPRDTFVARLDAIVDEVIVSRPTAVNLSWAAELMRGTVAGHAQEGAETIRAALLDRAHAIAADNEERHRRLAEVGADLFEPGDRILHHCNTGPLATAATHGTAQGVIQAAHRRHGVSVWVDETRPLLQGARLTTWELAHWGVPHALIADSMAAYHMQQGEIDKVIVGADRIAANGDVANKIGTYGVAVLADAHRIPFYVAAPISTIDFEAPDGSAIPIEQRDPAEIRGFGTIRWAPREVSVANPAFDITPNRLVTALITERGIARAPYHESLLALRAAADDLVPA